MKFTAAVSFLLAATASANPFKPASTANNAQSAYVAKLMRGAKVSPNSQLRRLEENIDLTSYSVKFEQCQFVKTYSDELADEEDTSTVLATQRFVIFRLCPDNYCASCQYNYGEYVVDLETYLEATVEYQQELQENMCQVCEEYYENNQQNQDQADDAGDEEEQEDGGRRRKLVDVDYDTCYEECQKIENMEENGYIDAINFLECQMIYDPEDDGNSALYAGPICSSNGSKIKIGVFKDEDCFEVDANKDVEDYLKDEDGYQMKLSHALLKTIYAEDTCISCMEEQEQDENGDDNADAEEEAAETTEMCRTLYEMAAKCEDSHGFVAQYNNNGEDNEMYNQESQEELVCDYITSLKSGTYDETGEIVVSGGTSVVGGGAKTTGGQKFALTFFILGTVGLAVYAAMLHSKLTKGGKADLSNQGGAMA
jgi:hypothetical protein